MSVAAVCAVAVAAAADLSADDMSYFAAEGAREAAASDETLNFLSAVFGDHMVLQRAPQRAVVWGRSAHPGATVETSFGGATLTAQSDANGTWRQFLPATHASPTKAYNISFKSSAGETAELSDVLFGDVYICGGQSNMQFAMLATENATEEIQLANGYPNIRLFTVGQGTSSNDPLHDLQTIEQKWSVASNTTVAGGGGFGYFSSVCWFFGRTVSDHLGGKVPIGLVSNNWGGTSVEQWSPESAFTACGRSSGGGNLYNAMIHPYTVGPMSLTGFTWYQGEANANNQASANAYACLFPAMIASWRKEFAHDEAYFGFVQLSTWCGGHHAAQPELRDAQMAALALPMVGYATNADHGAGCNIHPPPKQFCGRRLGDSALALVYSSGASWRSPSYRSATTRIEGGAAVVTVTLADVGPGGLTTDVYPANYVGGTVNCTGNDYCVWASIGLDTGAQLNATVTTTADGKQLVLKADMPAALASTAAIVRSSYAWGAIPLMNAYDVATGLPVLEWNHAVSDVTGPIDSGVPTYIAGGSDFTAAGGAVVTSNPSLSIRSGSPQQHSSAVLATGVGTRLIVDPAKSLDTVAFAYQYITGYGAAGTHVGSNFSAVLRPVGGVGADVVLHQSGELTDYSYDSCRSCYSPPVAVRKGGLRLAAARAYELWLLFDNHDRNMQLLLPITLNFTWA